MFFKKLLSYAFQLVIYKGSGVSTNNYLPLIQTLSQINTNITKISIQPYSLFQRNYFTEDTFLLGHSFGGYFALKDAQQDSTKKVKGVILLNSHFNSRGKGLYPKIYQNSISVPVLTLLGENDRRLPLGWGLDDLWESLEKNLSQRYYRVYPEHGHFSGLEKRKTMDTVKIACDISKFIQGNQNTHPLTLKKYGYKSMNHFKKAYDLSKPLNIIDYLYSLFLPTFFWNWLHFLHFLASKPQSSFYPHYSFQTNILLKTKNSTIDEIISQYESLFYRDDMELSFKTISLPPNLIGLYTWLLSPLFTKPNFVPILEWKLPNNVTYYKFPSPSKIIKY